MTLWSRLKTCFRMKVVGAPCCTVCADISCIVLTSNEMYSDLIQRQLLQCRLLFNPAIVIFLRFHLEIRLHVVVPEATKLRADDFVPADFRCREMNRDVQSGDEILLDAQFGNIERVSYILRMHEQVDLAVHWDGQFSGYDIVFGILVVRSIEAKEIRVSFTDLVGVKRAEPAIRTGVAEIKCKLSSLDLNRHRIGRGRSEIDAGPRLCAKNAQGQSLRTYQQEGGDHQSHGATGEILNLVAGLGAGEFPDEESQKELRGEK